jgi:hypothetical protein
MARKTTTNEKVMQFVEKELEKHPNIQTAELQGKAKAVDASVGRLTLRQFNARYPLQVKRKQAPPRPRRRRSGASRHARGRVAGNRDAMRKVLYDFAGEVAAAAGAPKDLVALLADLDRYVDRAVKAAGKK